MELIELLKEPVALKTSTYSPISHGEIHETIMNLSAENHFNVDNVAVKAKHPRNCIVTYNLTDMLKEQKEKEIGIKIGFKNSYDKTVSFGFAIGSEVFICTNGMVSGEYTIKKQHRMNDLNIYVKDLIREHFFKVREEHSKNLVLANTLKGENINVADAKKLIGGLFMNGNILTNAQLRKMSDQCYESKTFKTFADNDTITCWDLYNHGTEALKTAANRNYFAKHVEYNNFFKNEFGLN